MPACTITRAGRSDEFGRPLVPGQTYDGTLDQVRALVRAGFATTTDPLIDGGFPAQVLTNQATQAQAQPGQVVTAAVDPSGAITGLVRPDGGVQQIPYVYVGTYVARPLSGVSAGALAYFTDIGVSGWWRPNYGDWMIREGRPPAVAFSRAQRVEIARQVWLSRVAAYGTMMEPNRGSVVYIDPTSGTNGVGTLADPRNTWGTIASGTTYLVRERTTITANLIVGEGVTGSLIGTYETGTGRRVIDKARLASLAFAGNQPILIQGANNCISGLRVTVTGVQTDPRLIYGSDDTLADTIIEHCLIEDARQTGTGTTTAAAIDIRGTRTTVRFCRILNVFGEGIYLAAHGSSNAPCRDNAIFGNEIIMPTTVDRDGPDGIQVASPGGANAGVGRTAIYDNWVENRANSKQTVIISGTSAASDAPLIARNYLIGPDLTRVVVGTLGKSLVVESQNARVIGNYIEAGDWAIEARAGALVQGNLVTFDWGVAHTLGILVSGAGATVRNNTIILRTGTCADAIQQTDAAGTGTVISDNVVMGAFTRGIRYNPAVVTETRNVVFGPTNPFTLNTSVPTTPGTGSAVADPMLAGFGLPLPGSPVLTGGAALTVSYSDPLAMPADNELPYRGAMQSLAV